MRLDGLVAVVTGAGRGIGQAIALAFAREGAHLALAARSAPELEDTARQVRDLGAPALVIPTDVTDQGQVDRMAAQVIDRYAAIDILVNNAGVAGPIGPLQDNDPAYWVRTIQVNLIGTYLCCRAVLPAMLERNRGKIINMSGGGSLKGGPDMSAYGSTKAAVVRLTECLAMELAQTNVCVNAVAPGTIQTRMLEEIQEVYSAAGVEMPSGGWGSLERAADLVLFLASGDSGNLSGRLVSAVWDDYSNLPERIPEIMESDAYQLRRVELP